MSVCRSYLKYILPSFLIALIDTSGKKNLTIKIDLVEVVNYLRQVYHLLYDKGVMSAEALLYFSFIS